LAQRANNNAAGVFEVLSLVPATQTTSVRLEILQTWGTPFSGISHVRFYGLCTYPVDETTAAKDEEEKKEETDLAIIVTVASLSAALVFAVLIYAYQIRKEKRERASRLRRLKLQRAAKKAALSVAKSGKLLMAAKLLKAEEESKSGKAKGVGKGATSSLFNLTKAAKVCPEADVSRETEAPRPGVSAIYDNRNAGKPLQESRTMPTDVTEDPVEEIHPEYEVQVPAGPMGFQLKKGPDKIGAILVKFGPPIA
jgi:hypothetical protein